MIVRKFLKARVVVYEAPAAFPVRHDDWGRVVEW